MRKVVIKSSQFSAPREIHGYLKEQLNFPDYYGENLSALYDCLTDLSQEVLLVLEKNQADSGNILCYLEKLWEVFQDAALENPLVHIEKR